MGASSATHGVLPRTEAPRPLCSIAVMVPPTLGATVTRSASLSITTGAAAVTRSPSLDRPGHQTLDEISLEGDVEDEHRRARDRHSRHGERDLDVIAALEDADAGHQGALGIVLQEDD